jgi:hypothetical protein
MSGIVTVGEKPTLVCAVPPLATIRIKSIDAGSPAVWLGGPDVAAGDGYLIEPGHPSEQFTGSSRIRQTPVVPAPASDTAPAVLWGITDPGAGESRVTWISVS